MLLEPRRQGGRDGQAQGVGGEDGGVPSEGGRGVGVSEGARAEGGRGKTGKTNRVRESLVVKMEFFSEGVGEFAFIRGKVGRKVEGRGRRRGEIFNKTADTRATRLGNGRRRLRVSTREFNLDFTTIERDTRRDEMLSKRRVIQTNKDSTLEFASDGITIEFDRERTDRTETGLHLRQGRCQGQIA